MMNSNIKICPVCGNVLERKDYYLVAFDVPYCNLYVHRNNCKDFIYKYNITKEELIKMCNGNYILEENREKSL